MNSGIHDPMPNSRGEIITSIDYERINYWMAKDAEFSRPVLKLLGKFLHRKSFTLEVHGYHDLIYSGLSGFFPLDPILETAAKRNRKAKLAKLAEEAEAAAKAATEEESSVDSETDLNSVTADMSSSDHKQTEASTS